MTPPDNPAPRHNGAVLHGGIVKQDPYVILRRHADRMGAAEGAAQLAQHIKAGRKRETFGTGRKYPFIPSETLLTACAMLGEPDLTIERVLGFIHDPANAAFETERRMRNQG